MTRTATRIAATAVGLGLLAGCGTQNATDQAAKQAEQARTTAQQQLSSRGEGVLKRAQALAVSISNTAQAYIGQDLTRTQAEQRLGLYEQRANTLAAEAKTLPATSRARERLQELTRTLSEATSQARAAVEGGGDTSAVTDQADRVRRSARDTFDALRDRIPADTRQAVEDTLSRLGA